jgi:hypothetical protein
MHIDDQIETYIVGLKPHVYKEVVTKDWKTLHECMDYAAFIEARVAHRIQPTGGFRQGNRQVASMPIPSSMTTSTSSSSAAMDLSNIESTLPQVEESDGLNFIQGTSLKKLSEAERQRFRKEGRCFRCRQIGHIASNPACPKYQPPRPSIN